MKRTASKLGLVLSAIVLIACGAPESGNGDATDDQAPGVDSFDEASTGSVADARQILAGAARAMGGAALDTVHTLRTRAEVRSPRGSFETVIYSARDGRTRMQQTTGFHAGLHPSGDWIVPSPEEGRRPLPAELVHVVRGHDLHMIFLDPESRYQDPIAPGPASFGERPALRVGMKDDRGRRVLLFYGPSDTLPVGMLLETEVGAVEVELRDWRTTDGLRVFRSAVFRDRSEAFEYTYTDVGVNETTDERFLPEVGELQVMGKPGTRIDHLVYATPDLARGLERVEELFGVEATLGGRHPGFGTRNALIPLGEGTYLEIIGPDTEEPEPDGARVFGIDDLTAPKLVTWAAKGRDLDSLVSAVGRYGSELGSVLSGRRQRPDGVVLAWDLTDPFMPREGGVVPFFIDWGETPHPSQGPSPSSGCCKLVDLRAEHPEADRVERILRGLGLDLRVETGTAPALFATIHTPRGTVELR